MFFPCHFICFGLIYIRNGYLRLASQLIFQSLKIVMATPAAHQPSAHRQCWPAASFPRAECRATNGPPVAFHCRRLSRPARSPPRSRRQLAHHCRLAIEPVRCGRPAIRLAKRVARGVVWRSGEPTIGPARGQAIRWYRTTYFEMKVTVIYVH